MGATSKPAPSKATHQGLDGTSGAWEKQQTGRWGGGVSGGQEVETCAGKPFRSPFSPPEIKKDRMGGED